MSDSHLRAEDAAARTIAVDVRRSVVAQAPAGSGKTTLLLERYLRLLATVEEPEEILVVTFTRKAASEIRERVHNALERRDDAAVAAARQRDVARGWGLMTTPHRLRIQTIDAFSLAIARQAPVLAGLPLQCKFAEDAQPLYRMAVDRLFERMNPNDPFHDDLARVLALFENDYEACADALCTMLSKRDQWLDAVRTALHAGTDDHGVAQLIEAGVTSLTRAVIGDVRAALGGDLEGELIALLRTAAAHRGVPWPAQRSPDDVRIWRFAGEVLTTQEGRLRRQVGVRQGFAANERATKQRIRGLLDELRTRELDQLIFNLRLLPDPVQTPDDLLSLRRIAITLSLAALELGTVFERTSTVDFTELTFAARRTLGHAQSPTDLAMALDYRLRHLLVDEFQDTSVSQLDLLTRITEGWQEGDGRTFFAVGDPMQSIYRFRDAEVALMLRAGRDGVGELRPEAVRLRVNFRAAAALVDWVNRVFGPAFGRSDDPQLGRVAYADSVAARIAGSSAGARTILVTNDIGRAAEARRVLETIESLRERDPTGTIALLARSRTHLDTILGVLTAAGVPWHGSDIEGVGTSPVVRDLMVLLDAAADLDNRLAWLSLLRTPFIGIALSDLLALAAAPRIADAVLACDSQPISEDGRRRLARIVPELAQGLAMRDQLPPAAWLESLWRKLGGADAYPHDLATETHATHVFGLLARSGSRRIDHAALHRALTRSFTRTAPNAGDVLVMTIHRAKGLEFDHVLIPGIDRETRRSEPPLLLWRQESEGLLMSTSKATDQRAYRWLAREERLRETYERLRLFYVAVTRARASVHLFGCCTTEVVEPAAGSLLHSVWDTLRFGVIIESTAPADAPRIARSPPVRLRADFSAIERPHAQPVPVPVERPAVVHSTKVGARLPPAVDRVLRRTLCTLADGSLPDDAARWVSLRQNVWRASFVAAGVRAVEIESGVDVIARQVLKVLADPRGRWLFAAHDQLALDVGYTVLEGGIRIRLDVDRRFVDASGRRWLVVVDTATTENDAPELSRWLRRVVAAEPTPSRAAIYFSATSRWLEIEPSLDFAHPR